MGINRRSPVLNWPTSIYNSSHLRCAASGWWRALWWHKDARMNPRPVPLGFDNPAFGLQFRDGSLQIHLLPVYSRPPYAITPSSATQTHSGNSTSFPARRGTT
jgi:hypothetical protein